MATSNSAEPILIEHIEDARLEPYRAIRERDVVGRRGRFIAEGEVVLRVLLNQQRMGVESILLSRRRAANSPDLLSMSKSGTPIYVADDGVIEAVAGFAVHRGVLAVGLRPVEPPIDEVLAGLPERALLLVAIGISNHDNMGGLFRNAAAFGVDAVLLDGTCCDPLYRKAIRVSVGGALKVPFVRSGSVDILLSALTRSGFHAWALTPGGRTEVLQASVTPRLAIVVGAEGPGLAADVIRQMDDISIGMAQGFDSLNVATAAAIALHAARQHT